MKAIIYNTETGEIVRMISGAVPIENQRTKADEAILTDEDTDMPAELAGKKVDVGADPPKIVDDPDFSPGTPDSVNRRFISPPSKDAYRQKRAIATDETKTTEERIDAVQSELDRLFEILTGEEP